MGDSIFIRHASVVDALRFECSDTEPFSFQLHKHDQFCEMLLIREGEGTFAIDGKTYVAGPGTALLYHPGVWHEELSQTHPFRAVYIAFRGLRLKHLPPDVFLEPDRDPVIRFDGKEPFRSIYRFAEEIAHECRGGDFECKTMSNQLFGALLIRLSRHVHRSQANKSGKQGTQPVYLARRYIEANYDLDITLAKLASHSYLNAYHLAHKFKEEFGVSPIRFLIEHRIEVAKRYLRTTDLPVREIGELVGYRSETSFHHIFRKVAGVTPGQYRIDGQSAAAGGKEVADEAANEEAANEANDRNIQIVERP